MVTWVRWILKNEIAGKQNIKVGYMTEDQLISCIEQINSEKKKILNDKRFLLGDAIYRYLKLIIRMDIKSIYNGIQTKIRYKKVKKKFVKTHIEQYVLSDNKTDYRTAKIAVYICVLNNYDQIELPLLKFSNMDYFLITDCPEMYKKYSEYYKIIQLSSDIISMGPIKANRYVKLHPGKFLDKFDYAIYLDGNVRVIGDIRRFVIKCNDITGIAMHEHRLRDCLYDEAESCILLKKGNSKHLVNQIKRYRGEGMPEKYGLNEATVIVSDLKNKESIRLMHEWWKEFTISESLRDQIAWPYILWKNNYTIYSVGNLGENIYENNALEIKLHN